MRLGVPSERRIGAVEAKCVDADDVDMRAGGLRGQGAPLRVLITDSVSGVCAHEEVGVPVEGGSTGVAVALALAPEPGSASG